MLKQRTLVAAWTKLARLFDAHTHGLHKLRNALVYLAEHLVAPRLVEEGRQKERVHSSGDDRRGLLQALPWLAIVGAVLWQLLLRLIRNHTHTNIHMWPLWMHPSSLGGYKKPLTQTYIHTHKPSALYYMINNFNN